MTPGRFSPLNWPVARSIALILEPPVANALPDPVRESTVTDDGVACRPDWVNRATHSDRSTLDQSTLPNCAIVRPWHCGAFAVPQLIPSCGRICSFMILASGELKQQ